MQSPLGLAPISSVDGFDFDFVNEKKHKRTKSEEREGNHFTIQSKNKSQMVNDLFNDISKL